MNREEIKKQKHKEQNEIYRKNNMEYYRNYYKEYRKNHKQKSYAKIYKKRINDVLDYIEAYRKEIDIEYIEKILKGEYDE